MRVAYNGRELCVGTAVVHYALQPAGGTGHLHAPHPAGVHTSHLWGCGIRNRRKGLGCGGDHPVLHSTPVHEFAVKMVRRPRAHLMLSMNSRRRWCGVRSPAGDGLWVMLAASCLICQGLIPFGLPENWSKSNP